METQTRATSRAQDRGGEVETLAQKVDTNLKDCVTKQNAMDLDFSRVHSVRIKPGFEDHA